MFCPSCGLDKFFIDGVCGICHYDVYAENAQRDGSLCREEDF